MYAEGRKTVNATRLLSQMRLDLHMPGKRVEARCRPQSREFDNMADAGSNGGVDQRDFVDQLLWRRAMRDKEAIGTTKCIEKRMRPIEIDRRDADTSGQLNRIGSPGQHSDVDRFGNQEAGQGRADATCRTRYSDTLFVGCQFDGLGHIEGSL